MDSGMNGGLSYYRLICTHDAIKWWLGLLTQILPTVAFLSSSGPTASFPRLFTVTSEHIRFYFLVFLFLHFLVVGSVW